MIKVRFVFFFAAPIFLAGVFLFFAQNTNAAHTAYIVDPAGSDSNPGTELLPFKTPQGCINRMHGGDRCLIKNGTYVGSGSQYYNPYWNLCSDPDVSGTAQTPTVFKNYPGHAPKFCVNADCSNNGNPTFGIWGESIDAANCGYIRIEGLTFDTTVRMTYGHHIEFAYNELIGSAYDQHNTCEGNAVSGVFTQNLPDSHFHHNYLHDFAAPSSCSNLGGSGIIAFCGADRSVIEYNTFIGNGNIPKQGAHHKYMGQGVVIRYNHIRNMGYGGIWLPEYKGSGSCAENTVGGKTYGNVIEAGGRNGIRASRFHDNADIHHNTIVNAGSCGNHDSAITLLIDNLNGIRLTNNLVQGIASGGSNIGVNNNVWPGFAPTSFFDRNHYDVNGNYCPDNYGSSGLTPQSTLVGWRSALDSVGCGGGTACEDNSTEAVVTFASGPDTNYHYTATPVGAYGITNCVGHTCGGSATPFDTTPPAAPQGVAVL